MTTSDSVESRNCAIAFLGFSELGQALGRGLLEAGALSVSAYDLRFDDEGAGPELKAKAAELGVAAAESAAAAARGADIIVSAVTASAALAVANEAARFIKPGQFFLDLNSISPMDKQAGAKVIDAAGGRYVEGAVMSPVAAFGHRVPMVFGGRAAARLAELLRPLGMRIEVAGSEIGEASATKMCRSIIMKGLEALAVECLVTARHYGVEDQVIASLDQSFPAVDWRERSAYMLGRVLAHGARRAEEMRCAAETVRGAGIEPLMTEAIARRQQWVADLGAAPAPAPVGELGDLIAALTTAPRRAPKL